ncbi:MAG: hypothetical protein methR_P0193 [Methyloprofundus sp.]|nr:MAG: hypothetical protein methR_P0193 [Methyloprofundus sp.]
MLDLISFSIAIAAAVMAGIFFAFSSFVMTALGNIAPAEGIRAMQRINIDVFCWSFSLLFFGVPLSALGLGIFAVWQWPQPGSGYYLLGSIVYLVGCFGVTAAANVPLNNALARVDPSADNATNEWRGYLVCWTRWNHVRTVACLIACILIISASYAN